LVRISKRENWEKNSVRSILTTWLAPRCLSRSWEGSNGTMGLP